MHSPNPEPSATEFLRPFLEELLAMGGVVMRGIHHRGNVRRQNAIDHIDGYVCVSRAIRRSIILAMRSDPAAEAGNDPAGRKYIIEQVRTAIAGAAKRTPYEKFLLQRAEEPDSDDPDDEIPALPLPIILAEICRDLGLASTHLRGHAWKRQVPMDIRALCNQAARYRSHAVI